VKQGLALPRSEHQVPLATTTAQAKPFRARTASANTTILIKEVPIGSFGWPGGVRVPGAVLASFGEKSDPNRKNGDPEMSRFFWRDTVSERAAGPYTEEKAQRWPGHVAGRLAASAGWPPAGLAP
jgi:hypothetical protein